MKIKGKRKKKDGRRKKEDDLTPAFGGIFNLTLSYEERG